MKEAGSIRSSELWTLSGPDAAMQKIAEVLQMSSETVKKLNAQAIETNARVASGNVPLSLAPDNQSIPSHPASVYTKFLESVSLAILTSICVDGRWLRLGSKYAIGPLSRWNSESKTLKLESSGRELSVLSIALKWYPSGNLMATMWRVPAKALHQVSVGGNHKSTLLSVGSVILLAPSGKEAVFVGHFLREDHEMKKSIAARLRHQSIRISSKAAWIQIRFMSEDAGDLPVTMIWPACLCFSISGRILVEQQQDIHGRIASIDEWVDPLEAAENWYNGRLARAQAVEEAERQANERLAEDARNNNESEDEDMFMIDESLLNGRLNLQDASGVYPTPPDGAPPHLHLTASAQDHPSQIEGGAHTSIATQFDLGNSSLVASPTFNEGPSFNNEGDGDLFGELDSEMFAANGLTEDDFNFFDEQNPGELEVLGSYKSLVLEEPPPQDKGFSTQHPSLSPHHDIPSDADASQPSAGVTLQLPIDNDVYDNGWSTMPFSNILLR